MGLLATGKLIEVVMAPPCESLAWKGFLRLLTDLHQERSESKPFWA